MHFSRGVLPFPQDGVVRIGRAPARLRKRIDDLVTTDRLPPPNAGIHPLDYQHGVPFADPDGEYAVTSFGSTLEDCLFDVLGQFRPHPRAERRLAAVIGLERGDVLEDESTGLLPERWLAAQQLARAKIEGIGSRFVDVLDPAVIDVLHEQPRVQEVLASDLVRERYGPHAAISRSTLFDGGAANRALTQAVSRAVYELDDQVAGLTYPSPYDAGSRCWVVFERVHLTFDEPHEFSKLDPAHRRALYEVAAHYLLEIPPSWTDPQLARPVVEPAALRRFPRRRLTTSSRWYAVVQAGASHLTGVAPTQFTVASATVDGPPSLAVTSSDTLAIFEMLQDVRGRSTLVEDLVDGLHDRELVTLALIDDSIAADLTSPTSARWVDLRDLQRSLQSAGHSRRWATTLTGAGFEAVVWPAAHDPGADTAVFFDRGQPIFEIIDRQPLHAWLPGLLGPAEEFDVADAEARLRSLGI